MIDLKLNTTTWDLEMFQSDLQLVIAEDETIQHIRQRLLTFQAEWFLDLSIGLPWLQEILEKPQNINGVEVVLKDAITSSPGVTELLSFVIIEVPLQERSIQVNFTVRLDTGTTTENIIVELGI